MSLDGIVDQNRSLYAPNNEFIRMKGEQSKVVLSSLKTTAVGVERQMLRGGKYFCYKESRMGDGNTGLTDSLASLCLA